MIDWLDLHLDRRKTPARTAARPAESAPPLLAVSPAAVLARSGAVLLLARAPEPARRSQASRSLSRSRSRRHSSAGPLDPAAIETRRGRPFGRRFRGRWRGARPRGGTWRSRVRELRRRARPLPRRATVAGILR